MSVTDHPTKCVRFQILRPEIANIFSSSMTTHIPENHTLSNTDLLRHSSAYVCKTLPEHGLLWAEF